MKKWIYYNFISFLLLVMPIVTACGMDTHTSAADQFPPPTVDGNMTLYFGPSIKVEALSMIHRAKKVCYLTMYELGDGDIIQALEDAHRRGIDVKVIVDATEKHSQSSALQLEQAGILVHRYQIRGGISHIKSLLTDDSTGANELIGGMNFGAQSWENNDASVSIEHAGSEFAALFARDWEESAGSSAPDVVSTTLLYDQRIKPSLLSMIRGAKHRIVVEAFDLTDRDVIPAFIDAKRRRVDVRILLESSQQPNVRTADLLQQANVPVRYYNPYGSEWLHAKMIAVDGASVLIGSANFSYHAFYINHEGDLFLPNSAKFAAAITKNFDVCWARATDPQSK